MATKTTVMLIDDVTGESADESVEFGLDGTVFEIDLSGPNAEKLRAELAPWVAAARRTGGRSTYRPRPATPTASTTAASTAPSGTQRPVSRARAGTPGAKAYNKRDRDTMRLWARAQGYTVGDQGRISGEIQQAWESAGRPKM